MANVYNNKLCIYVCMMPKQLQQPGNITNTQHVCIKSQRDIYVRMYATMHTHTLVLYISCMHAGLTGVFKDIACQR